MMRRFVSVAPTGDIQQALFPSTRACIPTCTGKFKSTNSVQQFYCNEKNGRRGSAARQIRRRLNIKWDMTGALFLFRFHVLAPLWCVWARARERALCFFSPFVENRYWIGSDVAWRPEGQKPRRGDAVRRKTGKDCTRRCKRPITQKLEDSNRIGIQCRKNPKRELKEVRKSHFPTIRSISGLHY